MHVICWIPADSALLHPETVSGRILRTARWQKSWFTLTYNFGNMNKKKDKSKSRNEEPDMYEMD